MFRPAALVPCLLSGLLLASGAGADDAALKTVRIERIYVQVATGLFVERSFAAARRVVGKEEWAEVRHPARTDGHDYDMARLPDHHRYGGGDIVAARLATPFAATAGPFQEANSVKGLVAPAGSLEAAAFRLGHPVPKHAMLASE